MAHHTARDLVQNEGDKCVPVAVFGDDAPLRKAGPKQARSLIWFGVFCDLPSVQGKLLAATGDTSNPKDPELWEEKSKSRTISVILQL